MKTKPLGDAAVGYNYILVPNQRSRYSTGDRLIAVGRVLNGESPDDIAKEMGADRRTIRNWMKSISRWVPNLEV